MCSVVLVPGACCGPWVYADLIRELGARDVRAHAVELPSVGPRPPRGDLYADAAAVRATVADAADRVVLCGHSSGGMVISEAAVDLRSVAHLVYIAAPIAQQGESLSSMEGAPTGEDAEALRAQLFEPSDDESVSFRDAPEVDAVLFGPDCDDHVMRRARRQLQPMAAAVYEQPLTGTAWRSLPATFVRCEQDGLRSVLAGLLATSERRAARTVRLATGHSPQLSRPELVAQVLADICNHVDLDRVA